MSTSSTKKADHELLPSSQILGEFLLEQGLLSKERYDYALRVRSKLATPKTLLQVLKELGEIDEEALRAALRSGHLKLQIGDLLVELGYLSVDHLHTALGLQKESDPPKRLGQILTEGHFIEEFRLIEILSYQLGLETIDLQQYSPDPKLLGRAPLHWYLKHHFVPVEQLEDGRVRVAFADPIAKTDREVAENFFGRQLEVGIASERDISEFLDKHQRIRKNTYTYDENTVVGIVDGLLEAAQTENASDIHIEPLKNQIRVRFRCDGVLIPYKTYGSELAPAIASRLKVMAKADIAERRRHQGGRILYESTATGNTLDLRISFYVTIYGEKIVMRLLNRKGEMLGLDEIGMAPKMLQRFVEDALDLPSGVLIITGPTGSGKTTTLYSSVNYLNNDETSIITAEEPVEYIVEGIAQCSINPQIGVTFEETLRHIVRQDPDVIVLGEIRDTFSAETAIQAALTGHKVLTTFHTEDSIGGLLRLMNMEIEAFLISSTVVCVVAQRLLRRVCPDCAEAYTPTLAELQRLGYRPEEVAGTNFRKGKGCPACRFSGTRGRVGVFELLVLNEQVKNAILTNCTSYEIRRVSVETSGLVTLFEDGLVKAAQGKIPLSEVMRNLPRLKQVRPIGELCRLLGVKL